MDLVNYTNFGSVTFDALDKQAHESHIVVIRGTYDIMSEGVLSLADEQIPPIATDNYHGNINQSSLRMESDFAPFKPRCDVILDATAYAPGGKPVPSFHVSIRISEPSQPRKIPPKPYGLNPTMPPSLEQIKNWEKEVDAIKAHPNQPGRLVLQKELVVSGLHHWVPAILGGWRLTRPTRIASLPLRYEYAFGGMVTVYDRAKERDRTECCLANPVGVGYWPESTHKEAKRRKKVPAPQVFSGRDFTFGKEHVPEGFGPICRSWQPRLKLAGTYDDRWQKGRWPNLPEDFDYAFWNCAHPDLVIPYLKGDEEVRLSNLTATGSLSFRLPGHEPFILVRYEDGEIGEVSTHLDTLVIEPDKRKVSIVWRGSVPTEPEVRVLELRMTMPAERDDRAAQ